MIIAVILLSILCSASAQLFLKRGMASVDVPAQFSADTVPALLFSLATNLHLIAGVSLHIFALLTWLYVLKYVEVSTAYPFIALGFVFVLIVSYFLFGESISAGKLVGMATIVTGIVILGRSM